MKLCLLLLWWSKRNFPTMGYFSLPEVSVLVCNRAALLNIRRVVNAEVSEPVPAAGALLHGFQNPRTHLSMYVSVPLKIPLE